MRRSPIRRNSLGEYDCSDYKLPDECGRNYNCYYDYDEKECRNKRSPTTFTRSPYYQINERLPIESHKNIYSHLYGPGLRLVEYYPHNPRYILQNIGRVPSDEVIELLNYLPDTIDPFTRRLYKKLQEKYSSDDLIRIIAESGHKSIFELFMALNPNIINNKRYLNQLMNTAAMVGHTDIVEMMVELGATNFNEVLVSAARSGHWDIVKRMVELGATNFFSARGMADMAGRRDIVELIERRLERLRR
jgi:hypothetical protein